MTRRTPGSVPSCPIGNPGTEKEAQNAEACAPLVDPNCLIIERNPDKLHAYARKLLHQLRHPSRDYSIELVKAATVWLVGAYVTPEFRCHRRWMDSSLG